VNASVPPAKITKLEVRIESFRQLWHSGPCRGCSSWHGVSRAAVLARSGFLGIFHCFVPRARPATLFIFKVKRPHALTARSYRANLLFSCKALCVYEGDPCLRRIAVDRIASPPDLHVNCLLLVTVFSARGSPARRPSSAPGLAVVRSTSVVLPPDVQVIRNDATSYTIASLHVLKTMIADDDTPAPDAEHVVANRSGSVLFKNTILKSDHFPGNEQKSCQCCNAAVS
jgi:hypothetical protein